MSAVAVRLLRGRTLETARFDDVRLPQAKRWLTGVNLATGQPRLYGSAGVDIDCAVTGYTAQAPSVSSVGSDPGSQFPPR